MHDPESLLSVIRSFAVRYRSSPEIGWGRFELLPTGQDAVLAHRITADVGRFVAVHNFAQTPTLVTLELGDVAEGSKLSDLFAVDAFDLDEQRPHRRAPRRVRIPLVPHRRTRRPSAHVRSTTTARLQLARSSRTRWPTTAETPSWRIETP